MKTDLPPRNGRRALITGITGQDGSYLCELLLAKGYEVFGIIRRSSSFNTGRIDHLYQDPHDADVRLRLVFGDLTDASSINHALKSIRPDEVYNLGAQSHVRVSFDIPEYTAAVTGMGAVRVLESMRELGLDAKFYQASSSEMFGDGDRSPAARDDAAQSAQPLRRGEGLCVPHHARLPRRVRLVRGERHPVQPRVAAAGRDVRHAEDQPGRRADQARQAGAAVPGQSQRASATGALPATTSKRCGGCCRPTSRTTT